MRRAAHGGTYTSHRILDGRDVVRIHKRGLDNVEDEWTTTESGDDTTTDQTRVLGEPLHG